MKVIVRDINKGLIDALKYTITTKTMDGVDLDDISISLEVGDIFKSPANAIVSPANSFGYMDGGIDGVYCRYIGWHLQSDIQDAIREMTMFGELLVGQALTIPTKDPNFPYMISAPTMRMPGPTTPGNVFIATRAAIAAALDNNFTSVLIPGMGTGVGGVPYKEAAVAMAIGIRAGFNYHQNKKSKT